jgi:hypothetical protein
LRTKAGFYCLPDASFYGSPGKMAPSLVDEALLGTPAGAPSSIRNSLSPFATGRQVKAADHALHMLAPPRTPMMRPYPPDIPLRLRAVPHC